MLQAGDPLPMGPPQGAGDDARDERLVAFDRALGEVAEQVAPAYRGANGWLEQTRAGLLELLRFCDERPETARELVVDSIAWGPGVLERRGQLLDVLAAALDRARASSDAAGLPNVALRARERAVAPLVAPSASEQAEPDPPPSETALNLVGACVSLVHTRLLQDERGSLAELAPSLLSLIVQPYLGEETARRELLRPLTDLCARASEHESAGVLTGIRQRSY